MTAIPLPAPMTIDDWATLAERALLLALNYDGAGNPHAFYAERGDRVLVTSGGVLYSGTCCGEDDETDAAVVELDDCDFVFVHEEAMLPDLSTDRMLGWLIGGVRDCLEDARACSYNDGTGWYVRTCNGETYPNGRDPVSGNDVVLPQRVEAAAWVYAGLGCVRERLGLDTTLPA